MFFFYQRLFSLKVFPHFSRKFSASFLAGGGKLMLWLSLTALFSFNLSQLPRLTPSYWSQAREAVSNPFLLEAHLALAQEYWKIGAWQSAKRELTIAQDLWQTNHGPQTNSVLGATTSPLDIWEIWQAEPQRLAQSYSWWQTVVKTKPDYRDGYIQLGTVAYQLSKFGEAKAALNQALTLDPNNLFSYRLLQQLNFSRAD